MVELGKQIILIRLIENLNKLTEETIIINKNRHFVVDNFFKFTKYMMKFLQSKQDMILKTKNAWGFMV